MLSVYNRYFALLIFIFTINGLNANEICSGNNCDPIFTALPIAFGEMYTVGTVTQSGIGTAPTQLTTFNMNGLSSGTTPDHTLDRIVIGVSGIYVTTLTIAVEGGNNIDWRFQVAVNGIAQPNIDLQLSTEGTSTDIMSGASKGFLSLTAGDIVTVLVSQSTTAVQTLEMESANLYLSRIQ